MKKKHLGTITILIKDRQAHALDLQKVLTKHGKLILARLGVNVQRACIEHCTGLIVLAVEGEATDINKFTKELDDFYGVVAKKSLVTI